MARYFISAGETSGDLHAGALIEALRKRDPEASFTLVGGPRMEAAAATRPFIGLDSLSVMGFWAVIKRLPRMARLLRQAKARLEADRPDALIVVDFPTFNLRLARHARRLGIPVVFYICPKVWAWKSWRVKALRRLASRLLCILPFEPSWLAAHGVEPSKAVYVGNPSVEEVDAHLAATPREPEGRMAFIAAHNLTGRPIIALVPGSRLAEIRSNLPVMAAAVAGLKSDWQPVVAGAPGIDPRVYQAICSYPVVDGDTLSLMHHARAALVTSGTATLECALAGTPQVVMYRANGSRLAYRLMRRLIKVDHVSLPNLVAGRAILPELLLDRCVPDAARRRLLELLEPDSPKRRSQTDGYADMRRRLTDAHAATAAANEIANLITTGK